MPVTIRPYGPEDFPALQHLLASLQEHVAALDPLGRLRRQGDFDAAAYLTETISHVRSATGIVYLAEMDGRIVGAIVGVLSPPSTHDKLEDYPLPAADGKVLELIVDADVRGKQVGALLMQTMVEYFRARGSRALLVSCFAPNTRAHAFYEKQGFADRSLLMIKTL